MAEIYVISDTHFGHANIIKYANRPFATAKKMNEAMVENWNAVIKPEDKVYHLGDVYMPGGVTQWSQFFAQLNGYKRLILGNHDNGKDQVLQRTFEKIGIWRMFPEYGLLLTHVPVHESALHATEKHGVLVNVHGHIHQNVSPPGPYLNACVEWNEYKPVHIEEYAKWAKRLTQNAEAAI